MNLMKLLGLLMAFMMVAAACGSDEEGASSEDSGSEDSGSEAAPGDCGAGSINASGSVAFM